MRQPRFYFSLRSPYSWLAWHDLVTRYPDVADACDWRPFWEPDQHSERLLTEAGGRFVYTAMSREKHLYILQDVRRLAAGRGLTVAWPADREPVWEVPHLAYLLAERAGRGREFVAAAYRARFGAGRDICDPAVVADLATGLGLDPGELSTAADKPELRATGTGKLRDLHSDGVFGVPYFVRGYDRYWGVDRLPDFVDLVRAELAPVPARTTDWGHAGGCG
ncbi:DsbA family protein [Longispora sp. NPDC051575]|uniref:2-hydroxychromene-2-carboxylate isomerase n=1 Tax=Longispora sp. NPDC051575 TaxID=3154943 RepID=UPI003433BFE0